MRGNNNPRKTDFGAAEYTDTGCEIHSKCLDCPLPSCIYDLDVPAAQLVGFARFARAYPLVQQTHIAKELAPLAGVTERTAFRLIKRYKDSGGDFSTFILGSWVSTP